MKPQELFHDHPVIDEQDDGIYLYFHDLPPVLLHNTILPEKDDNQSTEESLSRDSRPPPLIKGKQ